MILVPNCKAAQGEQVLMSYGDQSNDSLLQFYGFVEPDCSCDCYVLTGFLARARKAAEAAGLATRYAAVDRHPCFMAVPQGLQMSLMAGCC